jgi:hypothetical protein
MLVIVASGEWSGRSRPPQSSEASGLDSIECVPKSANRSFGGLERRVTSFWMGSDMSFELVEPDPRVVDIGSGMEDKVTTGAFACAVFVSESSPFLPRYSRHLRFVGIKGGENFLPASLFRHLLEEEN